MEYIDVMYYLRAGFKVRLPCWNKDQYIRVSKSGVIVNEKGKRTDIAIRPYDRWEIFEDQ